MEHVYTWTEPDVGLLSVVSKNLIADPTGRYMILGWGPPVVYDTTTGESHILHNIRR